MADKPALSGLALPTDPADPAEATRKSYVDGLRLCPVAEMFATAAQSVPNNTMTALALAGEAFDTHGGHDLSVSNSRWTCPTGWAGYYTVSGIYYPGSGMTGVRLACIRKNGAVWRASLTRVVAASDNGGNGVVTRSCVIPLAVGDYVEVGGQHTQGAAMNTFADATYGSGMSVAFVRPT